MVGIQGYFSLSLNKHGQTLELLIILVLTLLNGFFALAEIALVSVSKSRIQHKAEQGSGKAQLVLNLLDNPENFLSSVQVGITLIGIVAGAYGGATLTDDMVEFLSGFAFLGNYLRPVSMILVIGAITYFTIVLGELVPKTLAINNSEAVALFCVPIVNVFTKLTYPFVRLLSSSTKLILKLLNVKEKDGEKVSEDELRFLLKVAGKQGVLEVEESRAMQNLFSFTDQTAKSLMTHGSEVEWIDLTWPKDVIFNKVKESVHSKFPVGEGSLENLRGVIHNRDLLERFHDPKFTMDSILMEPMFILLNTSAFKILGLFKERKQYLGIVVDEFGSVQGIITLHDLIEAVLGDLPDEDEPEEERNIYMRREGSYLIDGRTPIWELNQYFSRTVIADRVGSYSTISGYLIDRLRSLPKMGDLVEDAHHSFEIVDMDGVRIDKVLMTVKTVSDV